MRNLPMMTPGITGQEVQKLLARNKRDATLLFSSVVLQNHYDKVNRTKTLRALTGNFLPLGRFLVCALPAQPSG